MGQSKTRKAKVAIVTLLAFTSSLVPHGAARAQTLNPMRAAIDGVPRARTNRNAFHDLAVARPDAQTRLIEPPRANSAGDAIVALPIELPPGRNGIEPAVSLRYQSSGDDGWVGVGWDVALPAIEVDTRWGVPRYAPAQETETYRLDGEELTPLAHRDPSQPRTAEKSFHERVEGAFRKIVRHGASPKTYWWEVTDQHGVTYVYGDPGGSAPGLCHRSAPGAVSGYTLRDADDDVFRWALREIHDLHGNSVAYAYDVVADTGLGDGTGGATGASAPLYGYEIYPTRIEYTRSGASEGPYAVTFMRETARRPDVRIDARGGFKRVTAARLRRIDVAFHQQAIRSYQLDYRTGRLAESLLSAVTELGADQSPFNVHGFTYTDNPIGFSGVVEPWNTQADGLVAPEIAADPIAGHANASVLGSSKSFGGGAGTYVGFNPFTPTKQDSFGGKFWFDDTTNTGFVELVDVNGDGLPDKVWSTPDGFRARFNRAAPSASNPLGDTTFGDPVPLVSFPGISSEQTLLFSGGPEAYPFIFGVIYNHAETITTGSTYLADVNGDGLMDAVSNGFVSFNGGYSARGTVDFFGSSAATPVPIAAGSVSDRMAQDLGSFANNFPLADAVRRWTAPYDGTIAIGSLGPITLAPGRTAFADGVRVAIQRNGDELWSARLAPGGSTTPSLSNLGVSAGDRIYFRVQSIDDGSDDQVAWNPEIAYVGKPPARDVNGLDLNDYRATSDFALVGAPPTFTMPFSGTARVVTSVSKSSPTTDDVSLVLFVNGAAIARDTVRAADTGAAVLDRPFAVSRGDQVQVRVAIDSPIDLAAISADPAVLSFDSAVDSNGDPVPTTNANGSRRTTSSLLVPDSYPSDALTAPQPAWIADTDGTVTVTPSIGFGSAPKAPVAFTVKKRGALLGKITYAEGSTTGSAPSVAVAVNRGDAIYFDFACADPTARSSLGYSVALDGNRPAPPSTLHTGFRDPNGAALFAASYRQWSFAAYNGDGPLATSPIRESAFRVDGTELHDTCPRASSIRSIDQLKNGPPCPVPMEAAWAFAPDPTLDPAGLRAFRGPSPPIYVDALYLGSSRRGTTHIARPGSGGAVAAVNRISHTSQDSIEASLAPVGGNASLGSSESKVDYMDMNGDAFPDVVSAGQIQYTTPVGALDTRTSTSLPDSQPVRVSSVLSYGVSAGANPPGFSANARGRVGASEEGGPRGSKNSGQMAPLGFGVGMGFGATSRPGTSALDYLDMNGDGLPDRVSSDGTHLTVWLNLGYSFGPAEDWSQGANVPLAIGQGASANLGVDVGFNDGDYGYAGGVSVQRQTSLEGCQASEPGSWPNASACGTRGSTLIDVTGDGRPDSVTAGPGGLSVGFNAGSAFLAPGAAWSGVDAVATSTTTTVGGGGFFTVPIGPLCLVACWVIINPGFDIQSSLARQETSIRDVDGDGFADYVTSTSDGRMFVARNTRAGSDLLQTITRPLGGTISLQYRRDGNTVEQPQSHWVLSGTMVDDGHRGDGADIATTTYRYSGEFYDRFERQPYGYGEVVEEQRLQHFDTRTNPPAPDYAGAVYRAIVRDYATDSYYAKGLPLRDRVTDGSGKPFVEHGFAYRFSDAATGAIADTRSATASIFPALVSTTASFYEGLPTATKSTTVTYDYDALGRLTSSRDAGDVEPDDDLVTTYQYASCPASYVFAPETDVLVASAAGTALAHRQSTVDCATGDVTQSRAFVDGQTAAITDFAYFANGTVQQVTRPPNASGDRFQESFTYDADTQSHVAAVTDSFGYTSTSTYDPRFGAIETTTDPNHNTTSFARDTYGRLVSVTTPNEQGGRTPTVTFEYHAGDPVPWAATHRYDAFHPADPIDTVVFVDGLGRVVQQKNDGTVFTAAASAPANVMRVSGQVVYDDFGRAVAARYPITEPLGAAGVFDTAVDPVPPTTVAYDVLDRAITMARPDGKLTSSAFGFGADRAGVPRLETTSTDARGVVTRVYDDVRARTRGVKRFNDAGQQPIWTSYVYDPLGRVTQVTDDHLKVSTTAYDLLGRQTTVAAPDVGSTQLAYDLAGNLVDRVTPNLASQNKAIHYAYQMNRLSDVIYPTFPEHSIHYVYGAPGAADNGANRILLVNDAAGSEARSYGKLGEVTKTVRTISDDPWGGDWRNTGYVTQFAYDSFGRLATLTYPDGEVLAYGYDASGALQSAQGTKWGRAYPYVKRLEYDAFGAPAFYQAGNDAQTTYAYEPSLHRLLGMQSATQGYAFQNDTYAYDAVGNVLGITNAAALPAPPVPAGGSTQSFSYDDLNRLVGATGTFEVAKKKQRKYTLTQAYDTIDNITSKTQVDQTVMDDGHVVPIFATTYAQSYAYGGPRPHAPTHIGQTTYDYDPNGNQLGAEDDFGGGHRRMVWDDEDRLDSVFQNGGWQSFVYDDRGDRMLRVGAQGKTVYVNEYFTLTNGAFAVKHVLAGPARVVSKRMVQAQPPFPSGAPREDDEVFFHQDHNGNVNFMTNASGALTEHHEYFPFGETWIEDTAGPQPSPYHFVGKELDSVTGLYDFGARYYDARSSVWISADPLPAENRYGYASQNPTAFVDTDGRWAEAHGGWVSQNGVFFMRGADLFVRVGAHDAAHLTPPGVWFALDEPEAVGGHNYMRVVPILPPFPDCLHTAEEIMHNGRFETPTGRPSRAMPLKSETRSGNGFGYSHETNIAAAEAEGANVNEGANPLVGEAYAIVRMEEEEGVIQSPYHAAAVIGRDGLDTVTFETSAGDAHARARNGTADFHRQTIGGATSFHAGLREDYQHSRTIVLRRPQ